RCRRTHHGVDQGRSDPAALRLCAVAVRAMLLKEFPSVESGVPIVGLWIGPGADTFGNTSKYGSVRVGLSIECRHRQNQESDNGLHGRFPNRPRIISPKLEISEATPHRKSSPGLLSFKPNPDETLRVQPDGRFQATQGAR